MGKTEEPHIKSIICLSIHAPFHIKIWKKSEGKQICINDKNW
jgi:peroxiredoxin